MWPWRKSPSPDAAPRPAQASAGDVAPFARAPESRGDWQLLAPIQRVTTEPELINPVSRFQESLTAWQNPSFTGPLGHRLGADEPSGVITDIATVRAEPVPVHTTVDAPMPLAVAPPARAAGRAVQRLASTASFTSARVADRPVTATPVPAAPPVDPGLPVLTLPTVGLVGEAPAAHEPAPRPDAPAADPVHQAPTLGDTLPLRAADDAAGDPTGAPVPAAPGTAMPVVTPASGPSTAPTVARTPATDRWPGSPVAGGPAGPAAGLPPATSAPRRIGLGEPIVGPLPATPPVQRLPLAQPAAAPPAGRPDDREPAEAPLLGARSAGADHEAPVAAPVPATAPAPVPVLAAHAVATYPVLSPSPSTPPAPVAGRVVARLVGDAPPLIAPPEAVGGAAAGGAYPGAQGAAGPAPAPTGGGGLPPAVPVHRATEPAVAPPRPAPLASLVYASGATVPAPAVQRTTGGIAGTPLSALSIATASWVNPEVVQRIETVQAAAPPRPVVVQREEAPASAGDSAPAASPGETTAPAATPASGGNDAESMLAKLFDPLLAKIKTELRLDRERRGALTDLWH